MTGASPGPAINRGPTIHGQRRSQCGIVGMTGANRHDRGKPCHYYTRSEALPAWYSGHDRGKPCHYYTRSEALPASYSSGTPCGCHAALRVPCRLAGAMPPCGCHAALRVPCLPLRVPCRLAGVRQKMHSTQILFRCIAALSWSSPLRCTIIY